MQRYTLITNCECQRDQPCYYCMHDVKELIPDSNGEYVLIRYEDLKHNGK